MRWLMIPMVGGTLVLAVGSGASVPTATEGPVAETVAMAVSAAGVEDLCTVECLQGAAGGCEADTCMHSAPEAEPGSHEVGEGSHPYGNCWEGYCDFGSPGCEGMKHPKCGQHQNEQLAELVRLLEAGDLVAVSILAEADEFVEVAWEEGLLAVYQCSGRVSGTIALAGWELQSLASASVQ